MVRLQPRQPDWLAASLVGSESDNTARVLEFPATTVGLHRAGAEPGARPATALGLGPTSAHQRGGRLESLRSSVLSPEPAYKSVLGRLARGEGSPNVEAWPRDALASQPASIAAASNSAAGQPAPLRPASRSAQPPEAPAALRVQRSPPPQQPQQQQPLPPPPRPAAPPWPDPTLQQQLKERIERAKVEIKQQLSPLFRVSQALLLSSQDPQQAAQALEGVAAAGLKRSASDLNLLESVQTALAAGSGEGAGGLGGLRRVNSAGAAALPSLRDNPLFEQAGARGMEDLSPGSLPAEDVDSLVRSARAAESKAQTAIADLASPPRPAPPAAQPTVSCSAVQGGAGLATAAPTAAMIEGLAQRAQGGSMAEHQTSQSQPPSHPPQQQQQHVPSARPLQQQPLREALVSMAPLPPPRPLAVPQEPLAPDLEGRIAQLRSRSELVIRHECERIVAALHAMYDEFLHSVHREGLLVRVSMDGPGGGGSSGGRPSSPAEPRAGRAPMPSAALGLGRAQAERLPAPQLPLPQLQQVAGQQSALGSRSTGVQAGGGACAADEHSSGSDCGEALLAGESSENVAPNAAQGSPGFEFSLRQGAGAGEGWEGSDAQLAATGRQAEADSLGFSFGSPIRLSASQRPSPVKGIMAGQQRPGQVGTATARALLPSPATPTFPQTAGPGAGVDAGSAAEEGAAREAYPHASPYLSGSSFLAPRSNLGRGAGPTALQPASSFGAAISPADLQPTARFMQPGGAAGGGIGAAPAAGAGQGGVTRPQLGVGLLAAPPTGQHRDLDSIVSSIRRLAAETRLKHGALASSRLLQPAAAASSPTATLAATGLRSSPLPQPVVAAQTPASVYKTPLSNFGSKEGGGAVRTVIGSRLSSVRR